MCTCLSGGSEENCTYVKNIYSPGRSRRKFFITSLIFTATIRFWQWDTWLLLTPELLTVQILKPHHLKADKYSQSSLWSLNAAYKTVQSIRVLQH